MKQDGEILAQVHSGYNGLRLVNSGKLMHFDVTLPNLQLNPGVYGFSLIIFDDRNSRLLTWHYVAKWFHLTGEFVGRAPVQYQARWVFG